MNVNECKNRLIVLITFKFRGNAVLQMTVRAYSSNVRGDMLTVMTNGNFIPPQREMWICVCGKSSKPAQFSDATTLSTQFRNFRLWHCHCIGSVEYEHGAWLLVDNFSVFLFCYMRLSRINFNKHIVDCKSFAVQRYFCR